MNFKGTRKLSLVAVIAAIVLMALPTSAYLTFAPSPTDRIDAFYSYFSPTVFGWGKFFPLLAAYLSIATAILLFANLLGQNLFRKITDKLLVFDVAFAILSLLFLLKHPMLPTSIMLLLICATWMNMIGKRTE